MPTHDTLNRRNRIKPCSTGKCVSPKPRDILWFQKLHEHGPLTSSVLHAFSKHLCRSSKRARDRLTDLFNEDSTPHGGPYLIRPLQQFQTFDARYQELVYDLAPAAEDVLRQEGFWHERAGGASGPWKHRHMVASITAAIELATLDRDDLAYIPQYAILERANTSLRFAVPFENPATRKKEKRDLIPDALFGLEYRKGGESRFRFYLVEADRGTEPTRASRFNRKSHLRTFLQYREYVGRGLYKQHLNLTTGMLVLNVVTHERTLTAMLNLLNELSPNGNSYQLFKAMPPTRSIDGPMTIEDLANIAEGEWQRAGEAGMGIV